MLLQCSAVQAVQSGGGGQGGERQKEIVCLLSFFHSLLHLLYCNIHRQRSIKCTSAGDRELTEMTPSLPPPRPTARPTARPPAQPPRPRIAGLWEVRGKKRGQT